MLDRHAVQELVRAKVTAREIAKQFGVSVRTVRRILREGRIDTADEELARSDRQIGRPGVREAVRARVHAVVLDDPECPPGEICRVLRAEGTPLGLSTVYRVLREVRVAIPAVLQVRFEGVAGEFAQFDFGEASVRLLDGKRRTVHFAAYRLKYSRWMHVVIVPNERVEALIRSLLDSFAASGGVPLVWSSTIRRPSSCAMKTVGPCGMRCSRPSRSTTASRSSSARRASRSRRARSRIWSAT